MRRAHKIRLNPNPDQAQYLLQACGVARFVFNWGLAEWKRQYEAGEKPNAYSLKKQLNWVKAEQFPWMYEVTKCAVDTGFRNLDQAFKNFFRRCKQGVEKRGYPNFKSKKRSKPSIRMDGERARVSGHEMWLQKLDAPINMSEEVRFAGEIKSVTLSETAGYWYASFSIEVEPPEHEHPSISTGIDLGIKSLMVLSDGSQVDNQKLLRSELHKLKRLNRELSRRKQDSGRWQRTKLRLARFHERIKNRRQDYLHKATTVIAREYALIGLEDLNVAGMLRNHKLALSIADAGFWEIRRQLQYKAEWYGGQVVLIGRFFPSSKLCNRCGAIKTDLTLADRIYRCDCGYELDRDLNAARNIESEALRMVAGMAISTPETDVERTSDSSEQFALKRQLTQLCTCAH
jgi:putative transposase